MKAASGATVLLTMVAAIALAAAQSKPPSAAGAPCPPPAPASQEQFFFYQLALLRQPQNLPMEPGLESRHQARVAKLVKEGKVVLAGRFTDGTELREVLVLHTQRGDEAERWMHSDPAVKAGFLVPEFHIWIQPISTFNPPLEPASMEEYALVLYDKGAAWSKDREPTILRHMEFLKSQRETGRLVADGWFKDGTGEYRALLIFAATPEEAEGVVAGDPLIVAGGVKVEVHPWATQRGVLRR
ncbi:MAG TPA: YciI family protein [Terriglobales bacterium]|nr:YciI family protein [Terriglobales bacterium]